MNWKRTVKLKHILESAPDLNDDDTLPPSVKTLFCDTLANDHDLKQFVSYFKKAITVNDFNNAMAELYDFCDYNKIWIG